MHDLKASINFEHLSSVLLWDIKQFSNSDASKVQGSDDFEVPSIEDSCCFVEEWAVSSFDILCLYSFFHLYNIEL